MPHPVIIWNVLNKSTATVSGAPQEHKLQVLSYIRHALFKRQQLLENWQ